MCFFLTYQTKYQAHIVNSSVLNVQLMCVELMCGTNVCGTHVWDLCVWNPCVGLVCGAHVWNSRVWNSCVGLMRVEPMCGTYVCKAWNICTWNVELMCVDSSAHISLYIPACFFLRPQQGAVSSTKYWMGRNIKLLPRLSIMICSFSRTCTSIKAVHLSGSHSSVWSPQNIF